MMPIAALSPNGEYRSRKSAKLSTYQGFGHVELTQVPELVATKWIDEMRRAPTTSAGAPMGEVLRRAATVFADSELCGDSLTAHENRLCRMTGMPISVIRDCDELILMTLRHAEDLAGLAMPAGCGPVQPGVSESCGALWSRTGDVLTVQAAGNSPGVHALWLEALMLGYRIVVRPSNRDPWTPRRLISALRAAGTDSTQVVMIPTDHQTAGRLVERADRSVVYGGQDVVDRYQGRRDVRIQGPGRSKLVVASDASQSEALHLAVEGVLFHAGMACTSTTGVLVEDDPHRFAQELATVLGGVPARAPSDPSARLAAMPASEAERLVDTVVSAVEPHQFLLTPRVEPVGTGGAAVVTPAVIELGDAGDARLQWELPFPCVWVTGFRRDDLHSLEGSLVVSLATDDRRLTGEVADLISVANVYRGRTTSWSHPTVPHDSYLGEFLMRSRGFAA